MLLAAVQVITVIVNTSSMDSIMDASKEVSEDCATSMSLLGEISTDFEEMEKIAYAHCVADSASTMRSLEASIKDVYAEIVKPIAQSRKQLEVIVSEINDGRGDLTKRVPADGKNEIARMCADINTFIETLQGIMIQISADSK